MKPVRKLRGQSLAVSWLPRLPHGTLITYRGTRYFKSMGLSGDIVTCADGHWMFIVNIPWKTFTLLA